MKKVFLCLAMAVVFSAGFSSCKDKNKAEPQKTTVTTTNDANTAPVVISPDEQLQKDLVAATKDFPEVNYQVKDGEVTLTGTVERDRLIRLMQSVHALNPRKVNNQQLTIK
jgi:hypothetical protein